MTSLNFQLGQHRAGDAGRASFSVAEGPRVMLSLTQQKSLTRFLHLPSASSFDFYIDQVPMVPCAELWAIQFAGGHFHICIYMLHFTLSSSLLSLRSTR